MPKIANIDEVRLAFKILADNLLGLNKTILAGWPFDASPTEDEAERIMSVYGELSLHDQSQCISEDDRWYLAGQIVARIKRDEKEKG